jgi:hypothetical protein
VFLTGGDFLSPGEVIVSIRNLLQDVKIFLCGVDIESLRDYIRIGN